VSVDLRAFQYENSTEPFCMAYHFQGRVTCPYGQGEEDLASDRNRCRVPLEDGTMTEDTVLVAVPPQLVERRPEKSVYFTCACSGTDSKRDYCDCPDQMHCEAQTFTQQFGITGLCVRNDSVYDSVSTSGEACSITSAASSTDCGNDRANP
jgi:hypothetical protein